MILFNGPNTPFGRMAWATALHLGIEVENRVIDVYSAGFLDALNPLRQIPTLVVDETLALSDSRVICAYFHSLSPNIDFIPEAGWEIATRWSLAVGLMDASVARTMEMRRPALQRSTEAVGKQDQRIARAIAALEAQADDLCRAPPRIDRLATAVALEYIDFRAVIAWRDIAPNIARWLEDEASKPPLVTSRPYDVARKVVGGDSSAASSPTAGNTLR